MCPHQGNVDDMIDDEGKSIMLIYDTSKHAFRLNINGYLSYFLTFNLNLYLFLVLKYSCFDACVI
ncbi:hypothetical protein Lalb_Chr11g0063601 [Lupinus albus]|uniref:Uncharacterized protein n=1 Tax=Lupinus albus TaxID=3870 RepID=A0A6A4PR11_LUPAL|nr:hypothetical protein Lalb_Chr11g0063601 [Lupinus albus]